MTMREMKNSFSLRLFNSRHRPLVHSSFFITVSISILISCFSHNGGVIRSKTRTKKNIDEKTHHEIHRSFDRDWFTSGEDREMTFNELHLSLLDHLVEAFIVANHSGAICSDFSEIGVTHLWWCIWKHSRSRTTWQNSTFGSMVGSFRWPSSPNNDVNNEQKRKSVMPMLEWRCGGLGLELQLF
jgi:hypothetical protein